MLAFLFTLPFMLIHTSKIRHLFSVKSIIFPLAGMGVVCWATTANGGVSADKLEDESLRSPTSIFAWGIISQFNSVMGANSALLVTVPDLARYSKTPNAQVWGQLLGLPLAQTVCAAFGMITTVSKTSRSHTHNCDLSVLAGRRQEHVRRSILESLRSAKRNLGPFL